MVETDFRWALAELKNGFGIWRKSWNGVVNGKRMVLRIQRPDLHSLMNQPYIFMTSGPTVGPTSIVPWVASQIDLLASDWQSDRDMVEVAR